MSLDVLSERGWREGGVIAANNGAASRETGIGQTRARLPLGL
jgi:hypothetical protein